MQKPAFCTCEKQKYRPAALLPRLISAFDFYSDLFSFQIRNFISVAGQSGLFDC